MKALILSSFFLFAACEPAEETDSASTTTTTLPGSPTPGTGISFTSVSTTGLTVNWGAASDDLTATANLRYKLVSSTSNNIADAATAEANGTLVMDWTANTLSQAVTGLTDETSYYFTVLVKNDLDLVAVYTSTARSTLCDGKMIYLASVSMGNFGGKAGADAACNAQKPSGFSGTAKALLYDSTGRMACTGSADCTSSNTGRQDWPLLGSTKYCNTNYAATMGTTNAFAYLNVTLANSLSSSAAWVYTGLNSAYAEVTNANCSDWTAWANPAQASYGRPNLTGTSFHSYGNVNVFCSTPGYVYCVEQ